MTDESASDSEAYPFDRVVISDGTRDRQLSAQEFFVLPLAVRVKVVIQQQAAFFAAGVPVDTKLALKRRSLH